MIFASCAYTKTEVVIDTPRRVAAARRRERLEKDKVSLFPEMQAEVMTSGEYLARVRVHRVESAKEWRAHRAKGWREVRRRLSGLRPGARRGLMRYWETSLGPKDPEYLGSLITQHERDGVCFWHRLRELRILKLIGEGRLPRELVFKPLSNPPTGTMTK